MRPIDADELRELIKERPVANSKGQLLLAKDGEWVDLLNAMQTVEQNHGHWISLPHEGVFRCSVCKTDIGNLQFVNDTYCKYCGAKMDESIETKVGASLGNISSLIKDDTQHYGGYIKFYTDGDYHIDTTKLEEYVQEWKDKGSPAKFIRFKDLEYLSIDFSNLTPYQLCRLVETLVVNCRVIDTHHYVLKYLYDFLNGIEEWCHSSKENGASYYDTISGNYEGTECNIIYVKESEV